MTIATLYLLRYNNYYNRQVKKENTLSDYLKYQLGSAIEGVNFIPNDYVNTQQVVNWTDGDPNYLLVVDEDGNINSRWFVVATSRVREGQLMLDLHRDLVADFYNDAVNTQMFIEKAKPISLNDPAIFNNEDMSFNQIKTAEYLLKDKSNIAWIVGYVPRDFNPGTVSANYSINKGEAETVSSLDAYEYAQYKTTNFYTRTKPNDVKYRISFYQQAGNNWVNLNMFCSSAGGVPSTGTYQKSNTGPYYTGNKSLQLTEGTWPDDELADNMGTMRTNYRFPFTDFSGDTLARLNLLAANLINSIYNRPSEEQINKFLGQNNKILYNEEDSLYYKVTVLGPYTDSHASVTQAVKTSGPGNDPTLFNALWDATKKDDGKFVLSGSPNDNTYTVSDSRGAVYYKIDIKPLSTKLSVDIKAPNDRPQLIDSPYDMFMIPYPVDNTSFSVKQNGTTILSNPEPEAGFAIASSIAASLGKDNIYDVQLLPFCPMQGWLGEDSIDIGGQEAIYIKSELDTITKNVSIIIWCPKSEFTFDIPFTIAEPLTIEEKKIQNETEMWRLCSPNYSGLFEFSPAMNGGVTKINIDCNYKPFSPYIHANIDFNDLYGGDFNDSRGLVCGGDFSLPQVTSAWADYQVQNKNYQQMFDRGIQNMEVNNAVQREKEKWQASANVVSAYAQGKQAGGSTMLGRVTGLASATFSAIAAKRDIQLNDRLRNEALDYSKDMFGYQLQNIQALPQGLAKVSAFTSNNKIFPLLEKYECSEMERTALKDKLRYNGYTIMRIGTINDFRIPNEEIYIKGQMIRFPDDLGEDYHIASALADELYKGVFI